MDVLPWRTQIFLGAVVSVALMAAAAAISVMSVPNTREVLLALVFGGLMLVAWLFPLPLSFKAHFYLDTVIIVAAILLFQPAVAIVAIGSGTLIAQVIQRRFWDETLFNTAQTMLQAAAGCWLVGQAGWDRLNP
ncbi:MAG: hypothetical protein ACOC9Y_10245, partial [Chloroflexota bacterium]